IIDNGGLSATASVTVTINDINDWTPSCSPGLRSVSVDESFTGTIVSGLACTDKDAGNNALLVYSIVSGNTTVFSIDSATGQLKNAIALDYDLPAGVSPNQRLLIRIRDSATPASDQLSSTVTVTVTVTPLNENAPKWSTFVPPYTDATTSIATINETASLGTNVFLAQATDADVGIDGVLTYSMASATAAGGTNLAAAFAVDAATGQLSVAAVGLVDRESGHAYVDFVVGCSDAGRPTSSSAPARSVRVAVADINEFAPAFTRPAACTRPRWTRRHASCLHDRQRELVELIPHQRFEQEAPGDKLGHRTGQTSSNPTAYLLELACSDQSGSGLVATATVSVAIVTNNDYAPTVSSPSGSLLSLPEDQPLGQVAVLTPGDLDCCTDGQFGCSVSPSDTFAYAITSSPQQLRHQRHIVRGSPAKWLYSITVTVRRTTTCHCVPKAYSASIYENVTGASSPVTIATLSCSDADTFGIYYAMSSTAVPFSVDATTGVVTLTGPVDYDSAVQTYSLKINAVDKNDSAKFDTVTVSVTLLPVNEFRPTFPAAKTVSVVETINSGQLVTSFVASDSDYSPHDIKYYRITSGDGSGYFSIATNGDIFVASGKTLDYETVPSALNPWKLGVEATDGGTPALTGTGTVTISLVDANDNVPVCSKSAFEAAINENAGSSVTTVTASDADSSLSNYNKVLYTKLTGDPSDYFAVDGATGAVTRTGNALSYDTTKSVVFFVRAADGNGAGPNTATCTVAVVIKDVNLFTPSCTSSTKTLSGIREDVALGTELYAIETASPTFCSDGDKSQSLRYAMSSSAGSTKFAVHPTTGGIFVTERLNYETATLHQFEVVVSDNATTSTKSTTVTFTVSLVDVNEFSPNCSLPVSLGLNESAPVSGSLFSLACTDGDKSSTAFTYALTTAGVPFVISSTGAVSQTAVLNYESGVTVYSLKFEVADTAPSLPSLRTSTYTTTVSVYPVNEFPPVMGSPSVLYASVSEAAVAGTAMTLRSAAGGAGSVSAVGATDADRGADHGSIRTVVGIYSTAWDLLHRRVIGAVSVASALDRETQASLTLTIQATDGPGLTSTGSQQLAVTLTDVNDNPPEFPTAHFTIDIYEGTASPSTLITFTNPSVMKDVDVGDNAYANVSLASGVKPPSGPYLRAAACAIDVIVGVRSAELPVVRREVRFSPLSDTRPARVQRSHRAPVLVARWTNRERSILSPVPGAVPVAELPADSPHSSGGELVELLQSHPVVETLALTESARVVHPVPVEADGAVDSVLEGRPALHRLPHLQWAMRCCILCTHIDALRQAGVAGVPALPAGVHRSPIAGQQRAGARGRVEADGFRVLSRSHAVNVVDRQLHRQHPVLGEVASLETPAGLLGRGSRCHDSADDEQRKHCAVGKQLAWIPQFPPLNEFVMSGSALQTNRVFSRASDPAQYVLVVKAQDYGLPSLSASATVTVNILEANLAAPKFPVTDLTISVPENAAIGSLLYFANATDTDFGRGGKVAYHLASVSPPPSVTPPYFQLDNATGMLFLQSALDYDSLSTRGPYTLTILAYDFGNASRSSSQTLTISVTDYNDNDPQFAASNTFSKSLTENVGSGYAVTTVTYTDADSGLNAEVRCSIVGQTSPAVFGINDTTCLMFTTANPDREAREVREITVRLTDRGTPSRYKEATFTVTLLDLNDNVPQFPDSRIVASVVEEASAPVTVTTVTATDADSGVNAKISYSLRSADGTSDASKFAVDSAGKVSTTAPLDREAARGDFYALLLLAVDQGSPALTGTCLLNITVTDTNDNSPVVMGVGSLLCHCQRSCSPGNAGEASSGYGQRLSVWPGDLSDHCWQYFVAVSHWKHHGHVPLWTLTLEAADNGLPAKSVTTTLTVTVADVNEFAPAWVNASYNVAVSTLVGSPLVATDADAGPLNNQVNYAVDALLRGEFYFNIGNSTAQLFVSTAKLDRETRDVYYYRIRAWDSAEVPKTCTPCLTVTINILDVNDNDPVFNQTMYNSSLYENASIGTNVLSVWGSDRDIGENGNIRYYINSTGAEGFNASEVFNLDPVSGLLTVRAGLDRETKASY
uniref:Cadherin domain-containing protein n=1 Tax=Macrostomum lignano TaxID=282301 RepID=A0A1I8HGK1_9PLAT